MVIDGETFYPVPGFSRYLISKSGKVYSRRLERLLRGHFKKDGYFTFSVLADEGKRYSMGRHRFLCIAFKPCEYDIRTMVVNHINGIPGDDWLDNLEWTTHLGNIEHAGAMGLTTKCTPCQVMDIDTGVILNFPSAIKAARHFKIPKDSMLFRLRSLDPSKVYPERKQYRLGNSEDPWPINPDPESSILEFGKAQSVLVKDLGTGEVTRYPTLSAVSNTIKFSMGCLSKRMKKDIQPWFPPNLLLKWESNKDEWREADDKWIEYENATCSKVVLLIGETDQKIFYSAKHCADEMELNHTTVLWRVNSKSKPVYDGYTYHYYSVYTLGPAKE